jgi:hypothetical protein
VSEEIIAVYNKKHRNPEILNAELLTIKLTGTYSYHSVLKCLYYIPTYTSLS